MSDKKIDYPFTAFPNSLLDDRMSDIDGNTFKVLSVIIRKTIGFQKTSDKISFSQIEEDAGVCKTTAIKCIKKLVSLDIIKKYNNRGTNRYGLNMHENVNTYDQDVDRNNQQFSKSTNRENSTKNEQDCSNNEPPLVQKMNSPDVQILNTQKKTFKESKRNSSTTIKKGIIEGVIQSWNSRFDIAIHPEDAKMVNHIREALKQLSSQEIIQAMDNRLNATYYKEKKPQLLHRPTCFFPYVDTIKSDLQRVPDNLYTYDEHVNLINEMGYHGDDFLIRRDITDKNGYPMRELKKTATG